MKFSLKFRRKKKDEDLEEAAEAADEKPAKKEKPSGGGISEIKRWLFLHGEKAATLAIVALLALMVYSAIGKLELKRDQTPDDLKNSANQVRNKIENSEFPAARFPVPDYTGYVNTKITPIAPQSYDDGRFTGETEGPCRRCDPDIFPPQELQAKAGHGIFFVTKRQEDLQGVVVAGGEPEMRSLTPEMIRQLGGTSPPEGSEAEGRRWIVIHALVPYQRQVDAYDTCFIGCLGFEPDRDWPRFAHLNVRRIEIAAGVKKEWTVDQAYLDRVQAVWSGRGTDPVPEKFQAAELTQALGPLAQQSWKKWASHSKFAEFLSEKKAADVPSPDAMLGAAAAFGSGMHPAQRRPPHAMQDQAQPPTDETDGDTPPPVTEFKLVRLFDFDVEPGKSYRYQLQVIMKNPNSKSRGLPAFYLDNPGTMEEEVRESAWSPPGGIARVPHDASLIAAGIAPPNEERLEPAAEIIVEYLQVTKGNQPSGKLTLQRGQPLQGETKMLYVDAKSQQLMIDNSARIETDYTLIDLRQPEQVELGAMSPTAMLFMDNRGNLIIRDTADSMSQVDRFKKMDEAASAQPENQLEPQLRPPPEMSLEELERLQPRKSSRR